MATTRQVRIDIDGEALRKILDKRGLKMMNVSLDMGYDATYISRAIRDNKMAKPAINLLEDRYKIKFSDYEKQEAKSVEIVPIQEEEDTRINEEMANQLYQIIYSAVYQAVKKAWAE